MATFILLWISTTFSSMWSTVQVSSNILCISNTVWSHTECNRLDTMDACVRSGGWVAEQLLQRGSCLPYLSTWSLPLIVINGYDDVFSFIPLKERERKQEGVRKRKWKKESAQEKKKTASHLLRVFSSCLWHFLQILTLNGLQTHLVWILFSSPWFNNFHSTFNVFISPV